MLYTEEHRAETVFVPSAGEQGTAVETEKDNGTGGANENLA